MRLLDFIDAIEQSLGVKAIRNYMPMQPGDVPATWADTSLLQKLTNYRPQTDFRAGVDQFVTWLSLIKQSWRPKTYTALSRRLEVIRERDPVVKSGSGTFISTPPEAAACMAA